MDSPRAEPPVGRSSRRNVWLFAAVAAVIAGWLLWRWQSSGGFDFRDFLAVWTTARWGWLLAGSGIYLLAYYARAVRWSIMLEPLRPSASISGIFSATTIGFAALMLLGRPGEMVRPYLIARREKLPVSSQMAIWVLERIYDTLLLLIIFGAALAVIAGTDRTVGPTLEWILRTGGIIAAGFAILCVAVLIALNLWADQLPERLAPLLTLLKEHHQEKATGMLDSVISGLTSVRQVSSLTRIFLWSVFHWAVVCICYIVVLKAFPATVQLSMGDALVLMGFAAFGSIVQIPGIGGGPQVASTVVLVELFKLPLESATGISLVIYLVGFLAVVPLGLVLTVREGLSLGTLRHLKEEVET